ncbi:MAG: hypothetical protein P8168_02645 [Deltaproteobacteria bacterium]|jgi:signal transduction histidine kinase
MESKELRPPQDYDNLRSYLHELAQPLATVTGLVDLLLLELNERDKMFQEVRLISEQLEKIMNIIKELRQIVRGAAESQAKPSEPPETSQP